jgi:hypothetical protein
MDANAAAAPLIRGPAMLAHTIAGLFPDLSSAMNAVSGAGAVALHGAVRQPIHDTGYRVFQKTSADFESYRAIMRGDRNVL